MLNPYAREANIVMTSNWRRRIVAAALVTGFVLAMGAATRVDAQDLGRDRRDISLMFRKLGRGTMNILTGWVEIPKNIAIRWKDSDPLSGIVWGGFEGIGWGFARTAGGFYEVVTFPFPLPRDYKPIMEPEFILTPLWGEPAPFMTDEPYDPSRAFEE